MTRPSSCCIVTTEAGEGCRSSDGVPGPSMTSWRSGRRALGRPAPSRFTAVPSLHRVGIVALAVELFPGVRTVMESLEDSWHFKMVISRPGKVTEKT